ncbi:O-antigen polymerase [Sutcliffiella horikoshii]
MSAVVFLFDSIQVIFGIALVSIILTSFIILIFKLRIRLLLVWQVAFLYIIGFEGFLHHNEIVFNYGSGAIRASKYLVVTFLLTNIGYLLFFLLDNKKNGTKRKYIYQESYKPTALSLILIVSTYLVYIFMNIDNTVSSIYGGRSAATLEGSLSFLHSATNNVISMILPAILAFTFRYIYNFKKYVLFSIVLSIPIILILFIQGTRFPLLFSIAGLLLVLLINVKIKLKNIIALTLVGLTLLFLSELMVASRGVGIVNYLNATGNDLQENVQGIFYSREGVIRTNTWMIEYFDENPHLYGASSSFVLFFWVPRVIWPEKPTMLGYWLIREINIGGFGEGHSVSFGFAGDAYADFGLLGGMIFSLLLGCVIYILERRNNKVLFSKYNILYIAITYPFIFFGMRSLQTSLINFIGMIFFLWIFRRTIKVDKSIKEIE